MVISLEFIEFVCELVYHMVTKYMNDKDLCSRPKITPVSKGSTSYRSHKDKGLNYFSDSALDPLSFIDHPGTKREKDFLLTITNPFVPELLGRKYKIKSNSQNIRDFIPNLNSKGVTLRKIETMSLNGSENPPDPNNGQEGPSDLLQNREEDLGHQAVIQVPVDIQESRQNKEVRTILSNTSYYSALACAYQAINQEMPTDIPPSCLFAHQEDCGCIGCVEDARFLDDIIQSVKPLIDSYRNQNEETPPDLAAAYTMLNYLRFNPERLLECLKLEDFQKSKELEKELATISEELRLAKRDVNLLELENQTLRRKMRELEEKIEERKEEPSVREDEGGESIVHEALQALTAGQNRVLHLLEEIRGKQDQEANKSEEFNNILLDKLSDMKSLSTNEISSVARVELTVSNLERSQKDFFQKFENLSDLVGKQQTYQPQSRSSSISDIREEDDPPVVDEEDTYVEWYTRDWKCPPSEDDFQCFLTIPCPHSWVEKDARQKIIKLYRDLVKKYEIEVESLTIKDFAELNACNNPDTYLKMHPEMKREEWVPQINADGDHLSHVVFRMADESFSRHRKGLIKTSYQPREKSVPRMVTPGGGPVLGTKVSRLAKSGNSFTGSRAIQPSPAVRTVQGKSERPSRRDPIVLEPEVEWG